MAIAESFKAFFTDTIPSIINSISRILPKRSSSSTNSESQAVVPNVAVPVAPEQNLDSESQADVLNVSEQNRSESQASGVPMAPEQNRKQLMLEWQNAVMAFCFTSALEIAVLFAQTQSQLPFSFHLLSFAILLIFLSLFIANYINHSTTGEVLKMVAVMLVTTTVVFTITIPFPLSLKCVSWSLYAISLFIIYFCRYRF